VNEAKIGGPEAIELSAEWKMGKIGLFAIALAAVGRPN
jgi:hypothetical protein